MLNTQPITDRLDQYSKALADDKGAIAFKIRLEIERHCVDDLRALLAEISILNGALDAAANRITELEAELWDGIRT